VVFSILKICQDCIGSVAVLEDDANFSVLKVDIIADEGFDFELVGALCFDAGLFDGRIGGVFFFNALLGNNIASAQRNDKQHAEDEHANNFLGCCNVFSKCIHWIVLGLIGGAARGRRD